MKVTVFALIALVSFTGTARAHNGVEHMRGTLTRLTAKSITVEMPDKMQMTLVVAADTKFEKSGKAATSKDVKPGDRVVIDYVMKGKEMIAKTVKFGAFAPEKVGPKQSKSDQGLGRNFEG